MLRNLAFHMRNVAGRAFNRYVRGVNLSPDEEIALVGTMMSYLADEDRAETYQRGWLDGFNAAADVVDETFDMHEELLRDGFWAEDEADFEPDREPCTQCDCEGGSCL